MANKDNSTRHAPTRKPQKPEKPYPNFPLFAHANGRWAKKIRGKLHYFGPWTDPQGSLKKYLDQKDRLHSGLAPAVEPKEITVFLLCGKFLTTKKAALENGELAPSSFNDYAEICKLLIKVFGKGRLVEDLRPDDFEKLRNRMAKNWGPYRLAKAINLVRITFNYAYKNGLLNRPMIFGEGFKRPSKKVLRQHKAAQGPKMFEAEEIRRLLEAAGQPLRTMMLLAINCGFGNSDIGSLPWAALDLDRGWLNYPRPKTAVARKCPLWPETITALQEWLTLRPQPQLPAHADLVFVTARGDSWKKETSDNPISKEFRKLLDKVGITGHRGFYALRHSFQTVGDESRDFVAVSTIMGHALSGIANEYREKISDERLLAVSEHVRRWLFAVADDDDGNILPMPSRIA